VRTYNSGSVPALRASIGERVTGKWILKVEDLAKENKGFFFSWGIRFLIQKVEKEELKREIFPFLSIPDNDPEGIESHIEIERSGKIVKLEVFFEITHPSKKDLKAVLITPSREKFVLYDRIGEGKNEIKKILSTELDENLLPAVNKEMKGVWTLKIIVQTEENKRTSAQIEENKGISAQMEEIEETLDSWGVHIIYESDPEFF